MILQTGCGSGRFTRAIRTGAMVMSLGYSSAVEEEWMCLDVMDMLAPAYDSPQTLKTFKRWHEDCGLTDIDVHYGYNGIECRGTRPIEGGASA